MDMILGEFSFNTARQMSSEPLLSNLLNLDRMTFAVLVELLKTHLADAV